MNTQELEENFSSLINDVESMRPKRDGLFIERYIYVFKLVNNTRNFHEIVKYHNNANI